VGRGLEGAVADIEMGRQLEGVTAGLQPSGSPAHHGIDGNGCRTEALKSDPGIVQVGSALFTSGEPNRSLQFASQLFSDRSDGENLGAGDVEDAGWGRAEFESLEGPGGGVSLPNAVEPSHVHVDRLAQKDLPGQVVQNSITQVDGIVQAEQTDGGVEVAAVVFENPFASETRLRVFSARFRGVGFGGATPLGSDKWIHASGGEGDDSTAAEVFGHVRGNEGVRGPSERGIVGGAKFSSGHKDDVVELRQSGYLGSVEQIASECLAASVLESASCLRIGETGNCNNSVGEPASVGSPAGL